MSADPLTISLETVIAASTDGKANSTDSRSTTGVTWTAPKTSCTWDSRPHSGGGSTPGGGGGRNAPASLNSSPGKPSLTQVVMAIRPPGRQTRTSSAAAAQWSGANIAPKVEITRSKLASSNGRSWASASIQATSTPASAARRRACSNSSGVTSQPTTFAPRCAAGIATFPPVPVPTSTRSMPGSIPTRSRTRAPTGSTNRAKLSQSPAAQVARVR